MDVKQNQVNHVHARKNCSEGLSLVNALVCWLQRACAFVVAIFDLVYNH